RIHYTDVPSLAIYKVEEPCPTSNKWIWLVPLPCVLESFKGRFLFLICSSICINVSSNFAWISLKLISWRPVKYPPIKIKKTIRALNNQRFLRSLCFLVNLFLFANSFTPSCHD